MSDRPLWTPSPHRIADSGMTSFRREVNRRYGLELSDSVELHRWSVENIARFWDTCWDQVEVLGDKGDRIFLPGDSMTTARFFPDAHLNVAQNLLHGRGAEGDSVAILYRREDGYRQDLTWNQLRSQVAAAAGALRAHGVGAGDRVAAWMPNRPETMVLMVAAAAIGAMFSSTSADFGVAGVVDRFGQIDPVLLLASDGYPYGGKPFDRMAELQEIREALGSVRQVVMVPNLNPDPDFTSIPGAISWDDFLAAGEGAELATEPFPFDHPLFILFSSGTTGPPKCMVHRGAGVLLKLMGEHQLQLDIRPGDRVFYFTTCGWMMWNWLAMVLASGAAIVLYDGDPFHPSPTRLFNVVDQDEVTLLGVSAKFIDAARQTGIRPRQTHRLSALHTICSTGSPLSPEGFEWVYQDVKEDLHLASISGGTDLCGCFVGGDPTLRCGRERSKAPPWEWRWRFTTRRAAPSMGRPANWSAGNPFPLFRFGSGTTPTDQSFVRHTLRNIPKCGRTVTMLTGHLGAEWSFTDAPTPRSTWQASASAPPRSTGRPKKCPEWWRRSAWPKSGNGTLGWFCLSGWRRAGN